jgi:preprotein translocase SecE subunit
VAENSSSSSTRKKRRLKASPVSVREKRQLAEQEATKPTRRKKTGWMRRFFVWAFSPLVWLARRPFWQSKYLKPLRFIVKIIGYILFWPFIKGSMQELKYVEWPDFRTTNRLTLAVIMFAIVFGVVIASADYAFGKLFKELIINY